MRRRFSTAVVAVVVGLVAFAGAGCGDESGDDESTAVEPSNSGDYCDLIAGVVATSPEEKRADRAAYRAAVAAVTAGSPDDHVDAWTAMLAFIDDDSSERLNPAADGLDRIGADIERDCDIDLVLVDWDLLQDLATVDQPVVGN